MTHPESGKAARPEPIVDRILDELEEIGLGREMGSMNSMSWDEPRDRRLIREAFDDGGSGEAILPGFGATGRAENARDDCGKPHPHVCDSRGQSVEFGRTCAMSVCCRCARVWARDTGIRESAKVRRVRIEEEKSLELWQKLHHLVISPPPGWFYDLARNGYSREEALEITRDVVKSILDELRAQGLLVRHSYHGAREDGSIKSEISIIPLAGYTRPQPPS